MTVEAQSARFACQQANMGRGHTAVTFFQKMARHMLFAEGVAILSDTN